MKHFTRPVLWLALWLGCSAAFAQGSTGINGTGQNGGGGVSSVTGAGTVACTPTTGSVVCTGSGSGATSVTGTNGVTASPTTGAVVVSLSPIAGGNVLCNATNGSAAPTGCYSNIYPVVIPVTSTTLAAAESAACSAGGGVVLIPAVTVTAASGALTGPLPYCTTASVWYVGSGYSYGGTGGGLYEVGTHFIGNGTFDFFDYNNIDCGGGTCTPPSNSQTFIANMLGGVGFVNMTIDGFAYGIKCGALFTAGCENSYFANLNLLNNTQWGLYAENFWNQNNGGSAMFENIRSVGNTVGQIALCASGASANQNGNVRAVNLFSESSTNLHSRGVYECARGNSASGSGMNNFVIDGILSIQEGHTAATQAAVVTPTTIAVTPTNGVANVFLSGNPFVTNQPIIFNTSVGTGAGTSVTAGTVYYDVNNSTNNFQVAATLGGAAIVFNCSGTCASSTVSTPAIYVASQYTSFQVDDEVAFTGTTTNSNFNTGQTYYVIYSAASTGGSNGLIEVSNYPGGVPVTPAADTGAVASLNLKNWGPSGFQQWGYGLGTGGVSSILPGSVKNLDVEVNGGTANASINVVQARDEDITPGGYIAPGSTATYVSRSNNDVRFHPIANASQTFDIINDYSQPFIDGSRTFPYFTGNSTLVGGGISQMNPNYAASWPRIGSGSFMAYLSGRVGPDLYYNPNDADLEFGNFAYGAKPTQISGTQTIVSGSVTSNIVYTGAGGDTWTLPVVVANGAGIHLVISNPSAGTLTLATQSGQLFNGAAGVTTFVLPANTVATIDGQNVNGTYGYSAGSSAGASNFSQITALFNVGGPCASGFLRYDGACANPSGSGTVTTTGSPASGNLSKFSGATAVTNGDLSGDCTTSGTLVVGCTKYNGGTAFGTAAAANTGTSGATVPLLNAGFTVTGGVFAQRFVPNAAISGTTGQIYQASTTSLGISGNGVSQAIFANTGTILSNASVELTGIAAAAGNGYVCYGASNALSTSTNGCNTPISLSIPTGTATFAVGTGVTSVVCASGYSCNNTRGTLTIVGGTATTGTIATVSFSATLSAAPACFTSQNGGGSLFDIGNSAPTTSGFNITSGVTVLGSTLNVNYQCQP